jgi:hypothetical protein
MTQVEFDHLFNENTTPNAIKYFEACRNNIKTAHEQLAFTMAIVALKFLDEMDITDEILEKIAVHE